MAEDVNALKYGVLSDGEFMQQVELVYRERRSMFDYALDRYVRRGEGGLLFFYYSTVDLACHMMWRHFDPTHPAHDEGLAQEDSSRWSERPGSTWRDTVHDLYLKMDPVLGQLRAKLGDEVPLVVMSDHGFATYRREFNLNAWLVQNGYLVLEDDKAPESDDDPPESAQVHVFDGSVDWTRTRAYGIGFNGLYLNRAGRELDNPATDADESGIVRDEEVPALLAEIKGKLEALVDDQTGVKPVLRCDLASEVYRGSRVAEAPDLLVGYNAGYGNSDSSTTGRIPHSVLVDNRGRTFFGNHLMAPDVVPGLLLTNQVVRPGEHGLEDLTVEILGRYGLEPAEGMRGHRVLE
jgi:predicted AlkP superfamily phosphohydrolase/phosphomutase